MRSRQISHTAESASLDADVTTLTLYHLFSTCSGQLSLPLALLIWQFICFGKGWFFRVEISTAASFLGCHRCSILRHGSMKSNDEGYGKTVWNFNYWEFSACSLDRKRFEEWRTDFDGKKFSAKQSIEVTLHRNFEMENELKTLDRYLSTWGKSVSTAVTRYLVPTQHSCVMVVVNWFTLKRAQLWCGCPASPPRVVINTNCVLV